jgi:cytochrome c oxidase subunit 4
MAERIISQTTYGVVLLALLTLTLATFLAARVDLGKLNLAIAFAIAAIKGSLVVLYFMHARYSPRLTRIVIGAGLGWLAILLTLTIADYVTRNQM